MTDGPKDGPGKAHTALGVGEYKDGGNERTANLKPGKPQLDAPEIPGYRITAEIGEGGMGTVYEALQENPHRKVAIKVLHRTSQSALVRFQNEAEVMARLDHPGIARVLEAGEADGHPFLVMDFIDGKTLEDVAPTLPLRKRLELFTQVCDAVHHAHVKGVIHRDLKPTNVMVRDGERAIVLDFGVARLADDATAGPTRAGELIGTPLYMSPEQARLRPNEVDARTDVYTLGVILYELASGELPYEAPRGLPLPILTVLICDDPPVPLGKRVPALRGDLEAIVAKALAKEANDRYQSVAALADDVRNLLAGQAVSVRMPGPLERTRRFIRRRPLAAFAIASALSGVIVFASVVTALWLDARAAREAAEQAQARTEVARRELEGRTVQLTLQQARSAIARDPTEALAWLATLPPQASTDVDARVAWMIADEARARGVAADVLREHHDEVHWVEPLEHGFVTGGYDGRVIVWSPAPKVVFTADKGRIHVARPSPDGSRIAVGGDNGLLVVIGKDGTNPTRLGSLSGDVQRIEWSADGAYLAASSDRGNVWLFDRGAAPGRELMPTTAPDAGRSVAALTFAPNGTLLVAGNDAGTVRAWPLGRGAEATPTEMALGHEILSVWTDGARVLAVDADGGVHERSVGGSTKRDVDTKRKLKRVAFAPNAAWVAVGGVGGEVLTVAGDVVTLLHTHRAQVRSLAISGDERWIVSGGDDGSLVVQDQRTRRVLALRGHTGRIRDVAITGSTLYSGDSDGIVRRWELGELGTNVLATTGPAVQNLVATPEAIAAVDEAGTLTRWSLADGARTLGDHVEGRVTELAIDGATVIEGRADGQVAWHGINAKPLQLPGSVRALAVMRDVLVGTSSGPIQRCNRTGLAIGTVAGHPGGTDVIAIEPGGQRFASGGQDRAIRVWRPVDGGYEQLAELPGPQGDTHFLAYAPDATRLVAAGNDGAVFAWDVRGGSPDVASRKVLAQHTGAVTALAVANDVVVSAGRDNVLTRTFRDGTVERATIATAATTLALGADGTVFAVTRGGAALRWERGRPPVVEIDHGVIAAAPIDPSRWVLGFNDGALVVVGLGPVRLTDLQARIAALTSFRLPTDARAR